MSMTGYPPSFCLLGALAGDVIGSVYEFDAPKHTYFLLFSAGSRITDDSVLTLAAITGSIAEAYYGGVPEAIGAPVRERVPGELWRVVEKFSLWIRGDR